MRYLIAALTSLAPVLAQVQPPRVWKPLLTTVEGLKPRYSCVICLFADVTGDGYPDRLNSGDGITVFPNLGQGDFGPYFYYPAPRGYHPGYIDAGDFDGDGDLDVFLLRPNPDSSHLFINDGRGVFTDGTQAAFGTSTLQGPFIRPKFADIDNDGDLDLVLGCDGPMRLFLNDGRGQFTADSSRIPGVTQITLDLAVADMDGDGDLDIVTGNGGRRQDANYFFENDGTGHFFNYAMLPGGRGYNTAVAVGDLDGDGDVDILFARLLEPNVLVRNDGLGSFTDVSDRLVPNGPDRTEACLIGDIDADGDLDLVIGTAGDLQVQLNDGRGRFRRMGGDGFWGTGTTGLFSLILSLNHQDLDGDGDKDLWLSQHGLVGVTPVLTDIYFGTKTHLWSNGFAPVGGSTLVRVFGFEGVAFLAFAASRPTTHFATPFGPLWLDPATLAVDPSPVVLSREGVGHRMLSIPNTPSLRGRTLHVQALHFGNAGSWTRLTNWHKIVVR